MIADKVYAYDLSVPEIVPDNMPNKKDFKIVKAPKKVIKTNVNRAKKAMKKARKDSVPHTLFTNKKLINIVEK